MDESTAPMSQLCLSPSRSNWPVRHYDGRWSCSLPKGHEGQHKAFMEHDVQGELAWLGPWVDGSYYDAPPGCQPWSEDQ